MHNGINLNVVEWFRKWDQFILGVAGILIVVGLWQTTSLLGLINPIIASSPYQIVVAGIEQSTNSSLWSDFRITVIEFAIAFGASAVIGILGGLIMGVSRRIEYTLDPFIWLLYTTPLIAFYPLFVIWFGLGFKTVVMIGFFMSLIPITVNTFSGVKGTNPVLIRAAKSFGANNKQILFKVAFPSALPMIITGLRFGVERALIGVIVGEMFSANAGLGFRISYYGARLQTSNLFVSIAIVVLCGIVLTQSIRILEKRLLHWQQ